MLKLQTLVPAILVSMTLGIGAVAVAQDVDETSARESIESATRTFVEAFNNGDAATMASLWTKRGDFVADNGKRVFFQDRINAAATVAAEQGQRSQKHSSLVMTINTIRFVTTDVASVDGTSIYQSSATAEPTHARYTAVWVHKDNQWRIDSLRENQVADSQHNAHLRELAWLVGEWTDSLDNPRIQAQVRFSSDGNYLEREFKSELPGWGERTGTERIGWDAEMGQFRSWIFGHDGGFSQGIWTASERGWTIEFSGITADGRRTADQIEIIKIDNRAMELRSVDGTIDGQPLPDFRLRVFRDPGR